LRTTTFGGGQGGRSAEAGPAADSELAVVAGSDWLLLGDVLTLAAALQGAAFLAVLWDLGFATAGTFFGADDEAEAELFAGAGGLACGALGLGGAGADESAGFA